MYIVKLGYAGVYLFFLFLVQNMDCGFTLELPPSMFRAKRLKISKFLLLKFSFPGILPEKISVYCMGMFS